MFKFELSRISGLVAGSLVAAMGATYFATTLVSYSIKSLIP